MTTGTRRGRAPRDPHRGTQKTRAAAKIKPGTCFACRCTDACACDAGCTWTDPYHTMCSECDRRARAFLAWAKVMGVRP